MLKGTYFVIDDDATAAEDGTLNAQLEIFVRTAKSIVKRGDSECGRERLHEQMSKIIHYWRGRMLYVDGSITDEISLLWLEHILFQEL